MGLIMIIILQPVSLHNLFNHLSVDDNFIDDDDTSKKALIEYIEKLLTDALFDPVSLVHEDHMTCKYVTDVVTEITIRHRINAPVIMRIESDLSIFVRPRGLYATNQ